MEDKLLQILRVVLWDASPDGIDIEPGEWPALLVTASRHSVVSSLGRAVERLPEQSRPVGSPLAKLERRVMLNTLSHGVMECWIANVVGKLREQGIEGVLLKGHGLASLYPDPEMRQCGDIDFYVAPDSFDRALQIIKEQWPEASGWHASPKHTSFTLDKMEFEMHRYAAKLYTPWRNRDLQQWSLAELAPGNPGQEKIMVNGVEICLPPATYCAFFTFYHAWHHLSLVGLGMRHLCDIAMVMHAYAGKIDRDLLDSKIRQYGMLKPWQAMGCLVVDKIGLPQDEYPLYDPRMRGKAQGLWAKIVEGGNFGQHSANIPASKLGLLRRATSSLLKNLPYAPVESLFRYADRLLSPLS